MLRKPSYRSREMARYLVKAKEHDESLPKPSVELLWLCTCGCGEVHRKYLPWRRGCNDAALAEYIEDYIELVNNGYRPAGFESPPMPYCARVLYRGQAIAEWRSSPKRGKGSHVGSHAPLGSGGIPTAAPSASCSERLAVPTQPDPRRKDSVRPEEDPSNVARLDKGRPYQGIEQEPLLG